MNCLKNKSARFAERGAHPKLAWVAGKGKGKETILGAREA